MESLQLPELNPNVDWRVFRLQQFIDRQEGRLGWRLTDACRELDLGVSAPHAARLFRQCFGLTIREYTKRKRFRSATRYLENTPLSIKEIAANLGYSTPADFFRQFKEVFHVTPSDYRDRSRSESCFENECNSGTSYELIPHDA
jgi:AraC-like DNA-binding protein